MNIEALSRAPAQGPSLPFPVFRLSSRRTKYMLYDIDTVTWLRRTHHILGVQIGSMPQFPQQNVFFGLPLELMPEEARLLVDKGLSYIVDDLDMHENIFAGLKNGDSFVKSTVHEYHQEIVDTAKQAEEATTKAKAAEADKMRTKRTSKDSSPPLWNAARLPWIGSDEIYVRAPGTDETALLSKPEPPPSIPASGGTWSVTPTTASTLVRIVRSSENQKVQCSSARYAVFKHLHDRGYFMSPGLRFGCQLTAYPGDPLRFHSHFLCSGAEWDEELDLLDIVGGGRLGTGVKKGYLLGGVQEGGQKAGQTRTFCIEWGGL